MTAIRQEAIQIMQGINGILGISDTEKKNIIDLDQFVMPATERGQDADKYVRELRE